MTANDGVDNELGACQRCSERAARHNVRTQKLCDDCYIRYVQTKPVKRIEALRQQDRAASSTKGVKLGGPPDADTYLLALSGGVDSLALLHILDQHIASMKARSGRSSYQLHVLHIWPPGFEPISYDDDVPFSTLPFHEQLMDAFTEPHMSVVHLESVFDHWRPPKEILDTPPSESNPIFTPSAEDVSTIELPSLDSEQRRDLLSRLFDTAKSSTAKADLHRSLINRVITSFAQKYGYRTILTGDSATTLAERILGESAKGRGGSIPALLSETYQDYPGLDGESVDKIRIAYPLRELLRKGLEAYLDITSPPVWPEVKMSSLVKAEEKGKTPTMMKDLSIDELMRRYFGDVEGQYPGIVSNVVKTVGKLDASLPGARRCECCAGWTQSSEGTIDAGISAGEVGGMCERCQKDFGG